MANHASQAGPAANGFRPPPATQQPIPVFECLELVFKEDGDAPIEIPVHWDLSAIAEVTSYGMHQKRLGTPLGDPVADAWFRN